MPVVAVVVLILVRLQEAMVLEEAVEEETVPQQVQHKAAPLTPVVVAVVPVMVLQAQAAQAL